MTSTKKILVVDDCLATRAIIKDILRDMDLIVLESSNGNDAVSMVIKEHPKLIFLDLTMPFKSGLDVLEELSEEDFHTPVVVISSDISIHTKEMCATFGVFDYLEKPLDADKVRKAVLKYLE
jgi:DNA-binding NtrC family response regulator